MPGLRATIASGSMPDGPFRAATFAEFEAPKVALPANTPRMARGDELGEPARDERRGVRPIRERDLGARHRRALGEDTLQHRHEPRGGGVLEAEQLHALGQDRAERVASTHGLEVLPLDGAVKEPFDLVINASALGLEGLQAAAERAQLDGLLVLWHPAQ